MAKDLDKEREEALNKLLEEYQTGGKQRLKKLRDSLGLSQKEFAEPLGYKGPAYQAIEQGKVKLTFKLLAGVVKTYNISIDWLLTGEGHRQRDPNRAMMVEAIIEKEKAQVDHKIELLEQERNMYKTLYEHTKKHMENYQRMLMTSRELLKHTVELNVKELEKFSKGPQEAIEESS
ncbi:MAG: helix-turn-helix transcriptional regulator [Bacteroidota bacterium]